MEPSPRWCLDGEPVTTLPLPNRGLDFGDGVFETLRVAPGLVELEQYHRERLGSGLRALAIECSAAAALQQLQDWLFREPPAAPEAARVTVWRKGSRRGYAPDLGAGAQVLIRRDPAPQPPERVRVAVGEWVLPAQPRLAGLKHLNRLEQVMAAAARERLCVDEVLLLDGSGRIACAASANIFFWAGDRLVTPALEDHGIHGTRRRFILERLAPSLGIPVDLAAPTPEEARAMDEAFLCNALLGIVPVRSLDGHDWPFTPRTAQLREVWQGAVAAGI